MDSGSETTGGGPGKPPCWRTLEESCKGLGSVSLKINNQHTLTAKTINNPVYGIAIIAGTSAHRPSCRGAALRSSAAATQYRYMSLYINKCGSATGSSVLHSPTDFRLLLTNPPPLGALNGLGFTI